jgi:hypothetical protein
MDESETQEEKHCSARTSIAAGTQTDSSDEQCANAPSSIRERVEPNCTAKYETD